MLWHERLRSAKEEGEICEGWVRQIGVLEITNRCEQLLPSLHEKALFVEQQA
jgi:hypothetical protein